MIEIMIPGRGRIEIRNIVFDVNGTIATDGNINKATKRRIEELSRQLSVYLLTADTYGLIDVEMAGSSAKIEKIAQPEETKKKEQFVRELGAKETIAVGNGANDVLMLKEAILGICVVDEEGACSKAIENSDIVVYGKENAFGLLENPKRIVATLRC